jgi:hypothetical protein
MTGTGRAIVNDELLRLAERCEAATGPDEDLSQAIFDMRRAEGFVSDRSHIPYPGYHFTASLDAAMTLVPEGWMLSKLSQTPRGTYPEGVNDAPWGAQVYIPNAARRTKWLAVGLGQTGPLALCAAALRSRAHPLEGE